MSKEFILVVEDNEINSALVKKILSFYNYPCFVVEDGEEAIKWCQKNKAHLVLLDISLPRKDGLEVARELKQHEWYMNVPIVALTAHAMSGWRERCLQAGCCDYIAKPFRPQQLMDCIEKHLS